jgi:hypothetical protein
LQMKALRLFERSGFPWHSIVSLKNGVRSHIGA